MNSDNILKLEPEEIDLLKTVNNYGWLEDIKKYYYNKFNGKY